MQQLLTPKTLAAVLGMSVQTIYNRISNGGDDLPPIIRLGRLVRFRPEDVEGWLDRQQEVIAPAAPPPVARRAGRPTKAEQIAARPPR